MATYASETDIEALIGYSISTDTRPTSTQLAVMLTNADSIINAFAKVSSNMTDTFGILQTVACQLVRKMINNLFALAEPKDYALLEISLTEEDKTLIQKAHSLWQGYSWEMGID